MNDPTVCADRLTQQIQQIADDPLRAACLKLATDYPDFFSHPAAVRKHHAYHGGLLEHTLEVLNFAISAARGITTSPEINLDVVRAAALWHDLAKVYDYSIEKELPEWVPQSQLTQPGLASYTDYASKIHHIQGSAMEFTLAARAAGVSIDLERRVVHCILSHHGRKEWGSVIEPKTPEAQVLHFADMMSAHYGPSKHNRPNEP